MPAHLWACKYSGQVKAGLSIGRSFKCQKLEVFSFWALSFLRRNICNLLPEGTFTGLPVFWKQLRERSLGELLLSRQSHILSFFAGALLLPFFLPDV